MTSADGSISLWSWLILLSIFVVDATVTLGTRILRGDKFYKPHRSHGYQILARRWGSHQKVTFFVFFLNIVYCLPLALLASIYPEWGVCLAFIAFLLPTFFALKIGAGTTNN